jgi:hypothetical protein
MEPKQLIFLLVKLAIGISFQDSGTMRLFSMHFMLNSLPQPNAILCSCKFAKEGRLGGSLALIISQVKALCLKHELIAPHACN